MADSPSDPQPNVARDTDGRGSENQRADVPRDPNEQAVTEAFEGAGQNDAPGPASPATAPTRSTCRTSRARPGASRATD
jgi:hypothetical protein